MRTAVPTHRVMVRPKGPPAPEPEPVHVCLKNQGPRAYFRETNTLYTWNQINTLMVTQTVEPTNHESYSGINLISAPVFNQAARLFQKKPCRL